MTQALIEKLQALTGPCRECDAKIFKFLNPKYAGDEWQYYAGGLRHKNDGSDLRTIPSQIPKYTASVDAALTLIPEGWAIASLEWNPIRGEASITLFQVDSQGNYDASIHKSARATSFNAANTICIAALRAIESEGKS